MSDYTSGAKSRASELPVNETRPLVEIVEAARWLSLLGASEIALRCLRPGVLKAFSHLHGPFTQRCFYGGMNENAGSDYAAEQPAEWMNLRPGQQVHVSEPGHAPGIGVIDNLTSDGSVVWVWVDGKSRRMFVAGDHVTILPGEGNPSAC